MSATGATFPDGSSSYIHGGVVYQRVTGSNSPQLPLHVGMATCLSQGVLWGAVLTFLVTWIVILSQPGNGYNFYYILYFPLILCFGIVPGFVEGLVIAICTRVAGHNLSLFKRALVGALVLLIPYALVMFLFLASIGMTSTMMVTAIMGFLIACTFVGVIGATFGLLTGSRLDSWRELVRGVDWVPAKSRFMTGLTGFVLRLAIIFFLMQSTLAVIVESQRVILGQDFALASFTLVHFIVASVIVFAKLRFWLLLQLALAINFPVVAFMLEVMKEDEPLFWYATVSYLIAWGVFLIARSPHTYRALNFLREEIRYYLID